MLFDLDKYSESRLGSAVRSLPPNEVITLRGSGVSLTALPGGVRMFRLNVPVAGPRQPRVPMRSLRSAQEATELLLSAHQAAINARDNPTNERLEI